MIVNYIFVLLSWDDPITNMLRDINKINLSDLEFNFLFKAFIMLASNYILRFHM